MEVAFAPGSTAEEILAAIREIERRLGVAHPVVSRVFIEVGALAGDGPPV
jgi:hypothetical protein